MTERFERKFEELRALNKKALATFFMGCDPNYETSLSILNAAAASSDILEIGFPFSDPMADGPIIQESGLRALKAGGSLSTTLKLASEVRKSNKNLPIVLMGYYNPILAMGVENFSRAAQNAGVDGVIIVDIPLEEESLICEQLTKCGIILIRLITPSTDEARLKQIAELSRGFVYIVSVLGVTGVKEAASNVVDKLAERIRKYTKTPVLAGFGIKTAENAADIVKFVDGVVVGSALVSEISNSYPCSDEKIQQLLSTIIQRITIIKAVL